jgi:hypothetical protein
MYRRHRVLMTLAMIFRRVTSPLPPTRLQAGRFDRLSPLRYPCCALERWPSGRRRTPGKCVTPNRVRGFESHPLRQNVSAVGRILTTKLDLNGDGGGGVRTLRFDSAAAALDAGGFATAPAGRGPKARVNPTLSAKVFLQLPVMVARVCIFATTGHEPRQARKGAAVAA